MLAHLSDLHMGRSAEDDAQAEQLARALIEIGIDHVLVTGDVTHRGKRREWELFQETFESLLGGGRVTVVPGNHDRLGDDLGRHDHAGRARAVDHRGRPARHPRELDGRPQPLLDRRPRHAPARGHRCHRRRRSTTTPRDHLTVIALHHHVVPLPEEHAAERLSFFLGWPFTAELARGRELLDRIRGRCGLVLHGHRHVPRGVRLQEGMHTIRIFNAGSSTLLGGARIFEHAGGVLVGSPWWLEASASAGRGVTWVATPTVSHDREWRVA